jgi:hypothetical protein
MSLAGFGPDDTIESRARILLEAWLRGCTEGNQMPDPDEIHINYLAAVEVARMEAGNAGKV